MNLDNDDDTVDELPARPRQVIPAADRELLELAGRALGAVLVEDVEGESYVNLHFEGGAVHYGWNPLLFYGDTFELAADLDIEVRVHLAGDVPAVTATCAADSRLPVPREPWGESKTAARARAIVRAAAEIGKTK